MVGLPSALFLAAGLLAVATSVGLSATLTFDPDARPGQRIAGAGALILAIGQALVGAQLGPVDVAIWVQAGGLVVLLVGLNRRQPEVAAPVGAGLLVPLASTIPSVVAAVIAALVAVRLFTAGRRTLPLALGFVSLSGALALSGVSAIGSALATIAAALLIGLWLTLSSDRRILAKLVTAVMSALLGMAILIGAVLSTASSAELTDSELARLSRVADTLAADVEGWPAEARIAAQPLAASPQTLLTPLGPEDAEELFRLSLASQDFFVVLDAAGTVVTSHPPDLAGSVRLALSGAPQVEAARTGPVTTDPGGIIASGGDVVGFGGVPLILEGARPEDPPAGLLLTGRFMDGLWAAQQSPVLEAGIIGVVGSEAVFATDSVDQPAQQVVDALGADLRADLDLTDGVLEDAQTIFAATAEVQDLGRGVVIARLVTTSTPEVIANLELSQTRRLFVSALLGGILAALIAVVVTRRVVRPILDLTAAANRIAAGEMGVRADLDSADEVGVLGSTFDDMVASLAEQQQDLTIAAQREARLRGRFESLTSSMGDGLIATDTDGLIITVNPAAESLLGRSAEDLMDEPMVEAVTGRQLVDGNAEQASTVAMDDAPDQAASASRMMLDGAEGAQIAVSISAAPVRAPNGDLLGRVYVLRDITRDLQVERMKTEFLANVSHELRTPITPIKGYASVLSRRETSTEQTQKFATQILDSTVRLERIVGMIVDFAGLDSGRVTLARDPVDLDEVVAERLASWRLLHPDRELVDVSVSGLPAVIGDADYLGRLVDELVDNAIKFSPDGGPVEVGVTAAGDRVALVVRDQGVGISVEEQGTLFTDFSQGDGTETRHYGGLGLGLGLVKRIVDGMGATTDVASDVGVGTTVRVLLVAAGPVPARAHADAPAAVVTPTVGSHPPAGSVPVPAGLGAPLNGAPTPVSPNGAVPAVPVGRPAPDQPPASVNPSAVPPPP